MAKVASCSLHYIGQNFLQVGGMWVKTSLIFSPNAGFHPFLYSSGRFQLGLIDEVNIFPHKLLYVSLKVCQHVLKSIIISWRLLWIWPFKKFDSNWYYLFDPFIAKCKIFFVEDPAWLRQSLSGNAINHESHTPSGKLCSQNPLVHAGQTGQRGNPRFHWDLGGVTLFLSSIVGFVLLGTLFIELGRQRSAKRQVAQGKLQKIRWENDKMSLKL